MTETKKQELKTSVENALILAGVKTIKNNTFCCPVCNETKYSAKIYEKFGAWFIKCSKCGVRGDVVSVIEQIIKDDNDEDDCPSPNGVPSNNDEKNRTRVVKGQHVICVGSEDNVNAVNSLNEYSIAATRIPRGSVEGKNSDWNSFSGKCVYIWSDCELTKEVQETFESLKPAPTVYWVNPDDLDLPPNGDVIEFLEKYDDNQSKIEQLQSVMANANPLGFAKGVKTRIEDAISGKRETVKIPWYNIHYATQALKPGTVTLICGDGGAAKSLALLQLCQYWHFDLGHDLALYELEDDREYHLMRALAQLSKEPKIMDEIWVKGNPDRAREIFNKYTAFLDIMGKLIFEAPTEPVSLNRLALWVDEQAKSGKRIICIDPITAATTGRDSWIGDKNFIIAVKKSLVEYGASLVIVTHPKKGGGQSVSQDNLAGGASWSRFSQTIMWLKNPGEDKELDILVEGCRSQMECNRIMTVLKARNSYGGGHSYGMNLENLLLDEAGEIARKKKKKKDDYDEE